MSRLIDADALIEELQKLLDEAVKEYCENDEDDFYDGKVVGIRNAIETVENGVV